MVIVVAMKTTLLFGQLTVGNRTRNRVRRPGFEGQGLRFVVEGLRCPGGREYTGALVASGSGFRVYGSVFKVLG